MKTLRKLEANRCQHLVTGPTNIPELGISGQQIGWRPSANRTVSAVRASAGSYLLSQEHKLESLKATLLVEGAIALSIFVALAAIVEGWPS